MKSLQLNQQAFQEALDEIANNALDTIHLEALEEGRLQFRWADLCEDTDEDTLREVLRRNRTLPGDTRRMYEVLAKHIVTRFLMQRTGLIEELPCADAA